MDDQTRFKFAFMAPLAEQGYTAAQMLKLAQDACQRLKQADDGPGLSDLMSPVSTAFSALGGAGRNVLDAAGSLLPIVGATALVAPPALGAGIGYLAGRANDVDETDVEDVKKQQTIAEYQRLTQQLRKSREIAQRQLAGQASGRRYGI